MNYFQRTHTNHKFEPITNLRISGCYARDVIIFISSIMIITPMLMKAPRTLPEMVANPPVMTAWISDMVIFGKSGEISNGASV